MIVRPSSIIDVPSSPLIHSVESTRSHAPERALVRPTVRGKFLYEGDRKLYIRGAVATCIDHPALFAYSLGNEIPATMVRWLGRRKVEAYLERLYDIVKRDDPDALVTYVNYPSTEYLQLPFVDFASFNVYLES